MTFSLAKPWVLFALLLGTIDAATEATCSQGSADETCKTDHVVTEATDSSVLLQGRVDTSASLEKAGGKAALGRDEHVGKGMSDGDEKTSKDNEAGHGGSGGWGGGGWGGGGGGWGGGGGGWGGGGGGGGAPAPPPAPPPTGVTASSDPQAREWLLVHNYFRCIHDAPAIEWDNDVADGAKTWAAKGQMSHAKCYKIPAPKGPSGENLAAGQRDITAAVTAWYDENPERGSGCGGHCTALLWKKSKALGCSMQNTWNGRPMYVCRYARSAANFGSKDSAVGAQDLSKEGCCFKKYPIGQRWQGASGGCSDPNVQPATPATNPDPAPAPQPGPNPAPAPQPGPNPPSPQPGPRPAGDLENRMSKLEQFLNRLKDALGGR